MSCAGTALADTRLEVTFDPNPLFDVGNFIPGDEEEGIVTVGNLTEVNQQVIAEAINVDDPDTLGQMISLEIRDGADNQIFSDELAEFLRIGEVDLAELLASDSQTFVFTARFEDTEDNTWQESSLAFDLCIGFRGDDQSMNCGGTVIGEEQDLDSGDLDGDTPGGGTVSGGRRLTIHDERVESINAPAGTAVITWRTNLLATSQVIYGLSEVGPYTLDLEAINFGYSSMTPEDPIKVLDHTMTIGGLVPGAVYDYRVVSRASPPTISPAHQFTVPASDGTPPSELLALVPGNVLPAGVNSPTGVGDQDEGGSSPSSSGLVDDSVGAAGLDGGGDKTGVDGNATDTGNLAAALFAFPEDLAAFLDCAWAWLIALLIIYIVWRLWRAYHPHYRSSAVSSKDLAIDRSHFFMVAIVAAGIILALMDRYCALWPLIIVFIIFLIIRIKLGGRQVAA